MRYNYRILSFTHSFDQLMFKQRINMDTSFRFFSCWSLVFIYFSGFTRIEAMCLNSSSFEMTFTSHTLIDKLWFASCTSGRYFNISNNAISVLENDDFNILWNVQVVDLNNNYISAIENETFAIMRQLKHLYLANNIITEIPHSFFLNKVQLVTVDLSYNEITHIPRMVLEHDLPSIEQIILHHNRISAFEPWAVFRNPISLFDVRFNNITTFSNDYNWTYDFRSIYVRVTTDLRNNSITTWQDWFVMQYKQANSSTNAVEVALVELRADMRDNPLECDCNIYNITQRMKKSYFGWSDSEFSHITCHNPPHLRGKRVFSDVMLSQLVCNVTDDCPPGCYCEDRPHTRTLNVDCRGSGLKEVPSKLPGTPDKKLTIQLDNNYITNFENAGYLRYIKSLTMPNNSLKSVSAKVIDEIANNIDDASIDLRNNHMTFIPREAQNMKLEHVQLYDNPLECFCGMLWMVDWINLAPSYVNKKLFCTFEGREYLILDLDENVLNCINITDIILVIVFSIVCVILIALLVTAKRCPYETKVMLYKVFRIHPMDKYAVDNDTDKQHDLCVCFDEEDTYVRQWVKGKLFPRLTEKKPCYNIVCAFKNLPAGPEADGRVHLMERSRRLLIVLSENYETSRWYGFEVSTSEILDENPGRVMYFLYDKTAEETSTREPWRSKMENRRVFRSRDKLFWSKLRYELPTKPLKNITE